MCRGYVWIAAVFRRRVHPIHCSWLGICVWVARLLSAEFMPCLKFCIQALIKKLKGVILSAMCSSEYVRSRYVIIMRASVYVISYCNVSDPCRMLDSYLDLASALDEGAQPTQTRNPLNWGQRTSSASISLSSSSGPLPLRDVVLRPCATSSSNDESTTSSSSSSSGCGWKLNSSMLWIRCSGLRGVLEDFWKQNDWTEGSSGGFELELDADVDVLASLVYYVQTGVLMAPVSPKSKLELLKLSVDLEMNHLHAVALECVHQSLSLDNVQDALTFGKQFYLRDLIATAEDFIRTKTYPVSKFGFQSSATSSSSAGGAASRQRNLVNGMDLQSAIAASLCDVNALLAQDSVTPSSSSSSGVMQKNGSSSGRGAAAIGSSTAMNVSSVSGAYNIVNVNESSTSSAGTSAKAKTMSQATIEAQIISGSSSSNRPTMTATASTLSAPSASTAQHSSSGKQIPLKSGGIYSLLLQGQDGGDASNSNAIPRTAEGKMPGKVMGTTSTAPANKQKLGSKPTAGKPQQSGAANTKRSSSAGAPDGVEADNSFDSANSEDIVEYSNRMSLAPQKPLTQQQKRYEQTCTVLSMSCFDLEYCVFLGWLKCRSLAIPSPRSPHPAVPAARSRMTTKILRKEKIR
jgi:hypothetical protein